MEEELERIVEQLKSLEIETPDDLTEHGKEISDCLNAVMDYILGLAKFKPRYVCIIRVEDEGSRCVVATNLDGYVEIAELFRKVIASAAKGN